MIMFAGYYLFGMSESTVETVVEQTQSTEGSIVLTTSEPRSGVGSFAELQSFSDNFECQISYDTTDGGQVDGTLFLADGDLRADFLMENDEFGQYAASLIILPETTYSWAQIEGDTYGVQIQTSRVQSSAEAGVPLALNDPIRYDCQAWENVDGSVFTPPATVLFKDAASIEASGMEYGTIYEEELPY